MKGYTIFYDAYQEAEWFRSLAGEFDTVRVEPLNKAVSVLGSLLRYDKPDIILFKDDVPVLSLEKTTEVPSGHNVGQRFGRIVCAAEEGVLGIYYGPFLAMKHGEYASKCWINIRQLQAMLRISEIHGVPSLAVNWPCDAEGELIHDGTQDAALKKLIQELIKADWNYNIPAVHDIEAQMKKEIIDGIERHRPYSKPPRSVQTVETVHYLSDPRLKGYSFSGDFLARTHSLHYKLGMDAGLRSDPFTGAQLVYDYAYSRTGPTKNDRSMNLVVEIPALSLADWNRVTNEDRKDKRLLKLFPDILLLKDGYVS